MVTGVSVSDRTYSSGNKKTIVNAKDLLDEKDSAEFKILGNKLKIDSLPPGAKLTITLPDLSNPAEERNLEFINDTDQAITARFYFDQNGIYATNQIDDAVSGQPDYDAKRADKHGKNKQYLLATASPTGTTVSHKASIPDLPGLRPTDFDQRAKVVKQHFRDKLFATPVVPPSTASKSSASRGVLAPEVALQKALHELKGYVDASDDAEKTDESFQRTLAILRRVLSSNAELAAKCKKSVDQIASNQLIIDYDALLELGSKVLGELEGSDSSKKTEPTHTNKAGPAPIPRVVPIPRPIPQPEEQEYELSAID